MALGMKVNLAQRNNVNKTDGGGVVPMISSLRLSNAAKE